MALSRRPAEVWADGLAFRTAPQGMPRVCLWPPPPPPPPGSAWSLEFRDQSVGGPRFCTYLRARGGSGG